MKVLFSFWLLQVNLEEFWDEKVSAEEDEDKEDSDEDEPF